MQWSSLHQQKVFNNIPGRLEKHGGIIQVIKKIFQLIIFSYFISFPVVGLADDTPYQVEVIVFSQITPEGIDSEQWPQVSDPKFDLDHVIELQAASTDQVEISSENGSDPNQTTGIASFKLLPESSFILNKEADKLAKDPSYKVLLHVAWLQPASELYSAKTFHLYGGLGYGGTINESTEITDESIPYNAFQQWQLDGLLTIKLQRYFNLHFNLLLAQPTNEIQQLSKNGYFDDVSSHYVYFHMLQNRRTRSSELNFVGHPLMGVLLKIEKIKNDAVEKNNTRN